MPEKTGSGRFQGAEEAFSVALNKSNSFPVTRNPLFRPFTWHLTVVCVPAYQWGHILQNLMLIFCTLPTSSINNTLKTLHVGIPCGLVAKTPPGSQPIGSLGLIPGQGTRSHMPQLKILSACSN